MFPSRDVAMPLTEEDVCDTADLLVPFTPFLLLMPLLYTSETRGVAITIRLHYEIEISFFTVRQTTDASDIKWRMQKLVEVLKTLILPSVVKLLESMIRLLFSSKWDIDLRANNVAVLLGATVLKMQDKLNWYLRQKGRSNYTIYI